MKKISLFFCLLFGLNLSAQTWEDAGTYGQFSLTTDPRLEILDNGTPYLLYLDFNNFIQFYMWNKTTMNWDLQLNPFAGASSELVSASNGDILYIGFNNGSEYQVHKFENNVWTQVGDLTYLSVLTGNKDLSVEPVTGDLLLATTIVDLTPGAVDNSEIHRWDGTTWSQYGPNTFVDSPMPDLLWQEVHSDGNYSYVLVNQMDMGGASIGQPGTDDKPLTGTVETNKVGGFPDMRMYFIDEGAPSSWDNFDGVDNYIFNDPNALSITGTQTSTVVSASAWMTPTIEVRKVGGIGVWNPEPDITAAYNVNTFDTEMMNTDSTMVIYAEEAGGAYPSHLVMEDGGNWVEVGAPGISTDIFQKVDLELSPLGNKPYVLYLNSSGNVGVKVFNKPPSFNTNSLVNPVCQDAGLTVVYDDIQFDDPDHDCLWAWGFSQNQGLVADANISFGTAQPYNPGVSGNHFTMSVIPEAGMTGTVLIDVYATDGFDTVMTTLPVQIYGLPTATNTIPNSVCQNEGAHDLESFGAPIGGTFNGTGVYNNVFYPDQAGVGTYPVDYIYTDINGCKDTAAANIQVLDVPSMSFAITNADCGQSNGEVDATISGGLAPYSIYWSNGSTTEDVTGLLPTMYYMNVTDFNGCYEMAVATISSNGLSLSASQGNVMCNGGSDGFIDLNVTGTGPFTYSWSNGETTQDLSGLHAGQYEVFVSDGTCESMHSVTIIEPDPLSANFTMTEATCGVADGGLTISVGGGVGPFTYQWYDNLSTPIGTNADNISGFGVGEYSVDVTDANGCTANFEMYLSEDGGPIIVPMSITEASCNNDGAIDIAINSLNGVQSIQWSNGPTTEDITGLTPGYYMVTVTDNVGCTGMNGFQVNPELPIAEPICVVTVDTLTNTNLIVWEKPVSTEISHFNLYRESSVAGVFMLVDSILYTETSEYNDTIAYPSLRSWRYELTTVNNCGIESLPSVSHKTIHLVINQGLPGFYNLSWDEYEGFSYSTYFLYRHTMQDGWVEIDQLPYPNSTATDQPPNLDQLDYMVVVNPPSICTSVDKAQDYNNSRSNRGTLAPGGPDVGVSEFNLDASIYPNPSNGEFNIQLNAKDLYTVAVYDVTGKMIYLDQFSNDTYKLDLEQFAKGAYTLHIASEHGSIDKKIIVK